MLTTTTMGKTRLVINKNDLHRINKKLDAVIRATDRHGLILLKAGAQARDEMKTLAPEDTGRLKNNIYYTQDVRKGRRELTIESWALDPKTAVDYAPYQEFGTRYIRATPYFYDTARRHFWKLYDRLSDLYRTVLLSRSTGKSFGEAQAIRDAIRKI